MASNLAGMAFIPYYNHIMTILETDPRLKKTAKGIFAQMAYAAGGAAVGGMVAGPAGAMIGGIAGSLYGYTRVDEYDALLIVLREMSESEKEELVKKVQELVGSTGLEALTSFIGSQVSREVLINLVREFARGTTKGG